MPLLARSGVHLAQVDARKPSFNGPAAGRREAQRHESDAGGTQPLRDAENVPKRGNSSRACSGQALQKAQNGSSGEDKSGMPRSWCDSSLSARCDSGFLLPFGIGKPPGYSCCFLAEEVLGANVTRGRVWKCPENRLLPVRAGQNDCGSNVETELVVGEESGEELLLFRRLEGGRTEEEKLQVALAYERHPALSAMPLGQPQSQKQRLRCNQSFLSWYTSPCGCSSPSSQRLR